MNLPKWLKNEKLIFWNRCRLYQDNPEFREFVLKGIDEHNWLKVENCGDEYHGTTIYHIEAFGRSVGFFAEFLYVLIQLFYADERGFSPYVNWGKEFLYYEQEGINHIYNAFEYFFEPVSNVISDEHAAYLVHATDYNINNVQNQLNTHGYAVSKEYMEELSRMVKKYIHYNKQTEQYLEKCFENLIGDKRALAVHFRGTDYRRQYNNHPVFVTLEQEIEMTEKLFNTKGYDIIFLATDEQEAVYKFKQKFRDKVRCFEDTWRAVGGDESVAYSHSKRQNHKYRLGLEVLRDQYMLTRCQGLICGISNLTLTARMMRKAWYKHEYEDLVIIDKGLCKNDNKFSKAKH